MVIKCLFFYLLLSNNVLSQTFSFSADSAKIFARKIAENLPDADFYFTGQLHNNSANTLLERELLLALNQRYNVTRYILEYSHSTAFLVNEYFDTGNDSLLTFINPLASFGFVRSIKRYNDSVAPVKRIKFAGIDFEGREEGKHIKKVFSIILQKRGEQNDSLAILLQRSVNADASTLKDNLKQLASFLHSHWELRKKTPAFSDLLLICSAPYGMQRSRDKAMFSQFLTLYDELLVYSDKSPASPRFFASFGTGHINPRNEWGIANLLQSEKSPIKDKVSVTGTQYINSYFSSSNIFKKSDGVLNFLCKKKEIEKITISSFSERPRLHFIPVTIGNIYTCDPVIKKINGLIVIENFPASRHYIWE